MSDFLLKLAGLIGSAYIARWIFYTLFRIFYPYKLATPKNLHALAKGEWAVVTGSTDGIGKSYALELAKRDFYLVLVARNEEKLKAVAEEIRESYSVEVRTIVFDFTCTNVQEYDEKLLKPLQDLEIGILVNNVGCSYEYPERLDLVDGGLDRLSNVCVTNTLPVILLSASLLGKMVKRKGGIVINLASSAAYQTVYNWAVYSASKKFVVWLSEILRKEYAGTGVYIQTVCPMMVATNMSRLRKSFLVPDSETFAREALNSVGHVDETTGYFWHEIQITYLFKLCPDFIFDIFARNNAKMTKQKALKKRNKQN